MEHIYDYVIVGGGLAGASAVQGIRGLDTTGSILLVCEESHLPYDRPPLSKKLWLDNNKVEDIFLHDRAFYDTHAVTRRWEQRRLGSIPAKKSYPPPMARLTATGNCC